MIALIQRVTEASVTVNKTQVAQINKGILVFVGFEKTDENIVEKIALAIDSLLHYRVFEDSEGKMNLSINDIKGGILLVPQFTLAADTKKGRRPSFSSAMPPKEARAAFDFLVSQFELQYDAIESGVFGADMQVALCNDGPVTFHLRF